MNMMVKEAKSVVQSEQTNPVDTQSRKSNVSMLPLAKSLLQPVKNQQGMKTASIGLDCEHGKYGCMFFPESALKQSKTNSNMVYLPMTSDKEYKVSFGNKDNHHVEMMTGADIVAANAGYKKQERRKSLEADFGCVTEKAAELEYDDEDDDDLWNDFVRLY